MITYLIAYLVLSRVARDLPALHMKCRQLTKKRKHKPRKRK